MNYRSVAATSLVQAGVYISCILVALLVLRAAEVFLVVFGGILFAIFFHGVARWTSRKTAIPQKWSLLLCFAAALLVLGVAVWLVAPDVSNQASELVDRLPRAVRQLQEELRQYDWADKLLDQKNRIQEMLPSDSDAVGWATGFFASTFGALGNLVFALAVGLFLTLGPSIYIQGMLHLVPTDKRNRAAEVLYATGDALESWLIAKMIAMLMIGVLTTLGLWLIGIDLALVLGVIAALLSFIPNVGPLLALVPAVLIALISGLDTAFYVILLYIGIQAVESYGITPLLQQRMVDLPPALTISMQLLFGVLAGALGIILATPLTAAAVVMIKMWYVEDLLGDHTTGDQ
jgi:predicted PurR-regulated permease PerM